MTIDEMRRRILLDESPTISQPYVIELLNSAYERVAAYGPAYEPTNRRVWKNVPDGTTVIDTVRCPRCKVYHASSAAHECAPQIEAPK